MADDDDEPPQLPPRGEFARPEWFVESPTVEHAGFEPGVVSVRRAIAASVLALVAVGAIVYFLVQLPHHRGNPYVAIDFMALGLFVVGSGIACWTLLTRR